MIDIILGAFYGDEGKGQVVNNYTDDENTLVVRFSGGHQVGHTVRHGDLEHKFSNFGSGTLKNAATYWSKYCTVDPLTSLLERQKLADINIIPYIIFSPECELVTPFDVIAQWNDTANLKHGSVGTGFFPTLKRVRDGYHLQVIDAFNPLVLKAKLEAIRSNYYSNFKSTNQTVDYNIDEWCTKVSMFFHYQRIVRNFEELMQEYDHIIFEGSQGILLDQVHGIMPYCTPSYTTAKNALELIGSSKDKVHLHLVTRPYITRHGNGPIPTSKPVIEKFSDPNNKFNEFQKTMRATEMDLNLLTSSLYYATSDYKFDKISLDVTHFDEIKSQELSEYAEHNRLGYVQHYYEERR